MSQVRKLLSPKTIVRLRQVGFTVNDTSASPGADTITFSGAAPGGKDGVLARYVKGRNNVTRLRRAGIWA